MNRSLSPNPSSSRIAAAAVVLSGIAACPGVAVGVAVVLAPRRVSYVRRLVRSAAVDAEIERFERAVAAAEEELRLVASTSQSTFARAEMSILEAYVLMLSDELLSGAVERNIRVNHQCAEWAVANAIGEFAAQVGGASEAYLRERSHDFEFVGERLILALTGAASGRSLPKLTEPCVVIARDLSPADVLALDPENILAIATEVGTKTSHTGIVARALEIPSVVGIPGLFDRVTSGDRVIVDGLRGIVTLRPTDEMVESGVALGQRHRDLARLLLGDVSRPCELFTGEHVELTANIEFSCEASYAASHGAEGVGLYRTEFLYFDRVEPPGEDEQVQHFRAVIEAMQGRPVTLRTFDMGGDKPIGAALPQPEANPALGVRGVRLALGHPDLFLAQLRAMIRASAYGPVRVMVPMISTLGEWAEVRRLFARAQEEVRSAGHAYQTDIPLGMMVEVPSVAIRADVFAKHAAFFSLGTNDLVQYTLAVDRTSPSLARLASSFDPSVLQLARGVAEAGRRAGKPVTVCGAMAGDPLGAILLVGLGFRSLSMEPTAIPEIKEALHRVSLFEATRAAEQALEQATAEEVEHLLAVEFAPRLFDLLSGDEANAPT